jgi:hypothetical protein
MYSDDQEAGMSCLLDELDDSVYISYRKFMLHGSTECRKQAAPSQEKPDL